MKIGVCFKIVPDFEDTDPSDWETPEALDFRYVKKIYGCYDEAALETALRLQDQLRAAGVEASTTAVTLGAPDSTTAEASMRALFAAGFQDVVTIPGPADFQPRYTAAVLADYFRNNPVDLILCGKMVGPGDSGMVPLHLARELDLDFFPEVTAAAYDPDLGSVVLSCKEATAVHRRQVTAKALCTLGDAEAAYLRLFPLKARMAARSRSFTLWPNSRETDAPRLTLYRPAVPDSQCRYLTPETAPDELLEILKGGSRS